MTIFVPPIAIEKKTLHSLKRGIALNTKGTGRKPLSLVIEGGNKIFTQLQIKVFIDAIGDLETMGVMSNSTTTMLVKMCTPRGVNECTKLNK